jgi:hypothetical protein
MSAMNGPLNLRRGKFIGLSTVSSPRIRLTTLRISGASAKRERPLHPRVEQRQLWRHWTQPTVA